MDNSVLLFVQKLLSVNNISCHIISTSFKNFKEIDLGLRNNILKNQDINYELYTFIHNCKNNVLYNIIDSYYCSYSLLMLPPQQYGNSCYLIIGPYIFENIDSIRFTQITEFLKLPIELIPQMREYYNSITFIPYETAFKSMLSFLASEIFENEHFEIEFCKNQFWSDKEYLDYTELEKPSLYMNLIEERYIIENQLIHAVSCGNLTKALNVLYKMSHKKITQRFDDPIRDTKNKLIILNSLLRKAVESGHVYPVHIDKTSEKFARKIEMITNINDGDKISYEMVRKYCFLVKNYSLKHYCLTIQKVINYIDINLSEDLGLNTLSKILGVNSSYLSSLFKKETDLTLTHYVQKKRIEHSLFLLNTTDMQIQNIASYVGITDVNYFTKLFKKFIGKTPKEYRTIIHY